MSDRVWGSTTKPLSGSGHLRDLTTAVIFEVIVLIVAVVSVGILVAMEGAARAVTTRPITASDPNSAE
jgi:hypothetical protein